MKLCIDCEHFRPVSGPLLSNESSARCAHPRFVSMVTGELAPELCSTERILSHAPHCGPEARNFTPVLCAFCGKRPAHADDLCEECLQNRAKAAYEDSLGEAFRGNEAAGFLAEQQSAAMRLK